MRWLQYKDGTRHPEESSLLAYVRQQNLEDIKQLHQHIVQCSSCQRICEGYIQVSDQLQVVRQMQRNLYYPEPLAETVIARVEREQSCLFYNPFYLDSFRIPGLAPLSALFLCLFLGVLVTFASGHTSLLPTFGLDRSENTGTKSTGVTIPSRQLTPTIEPSQQPGSNGQSLGVTPTASVVAQATPTSVVATATPQTQSSIIEICHVQIDPDDPGSGRMEICGSHFQVGDRISLVVDRRGMAPQVQPPVQADDRGGFHKIIVVHSCKEVPIAIYAQDQSNRNLSSNILENVPFGNCTATFSGPREKKRT